MIIQSLLDTDLYKLSMMQLVFHRFPKVSVGYQFICRNEGIDLLPYADEIRHELDQFCCLRFTEDELIYLSQLNFFQADFLEFLKDFQLQAEHIEITQTDRETIMAIHDWKKIIFSQARQTIALSLPIILSELAGSIGGFIGTLMIARLGQEALAASALVNTTCMALMATVWGVLLAVGVLVANAYGAQQHEKIANYVRQGFWIAIVLSMLVTLVMLNATPIFLRH